VGQTWGSVLICLLGVYLLLTVGAIWRPPKIPPSFRPRFLNIIVVCSAKLLPLLPPLHDLSLHFTSPSHYPNDVNRSPSFSLKRIPIANIPIEVKKAAFSLADFNDFIIAQEWAGFQWETEHKLGAFIRIERLAAIEQLLAFVVLYGDLLIRGTDISRSKIVNKRYRGTMIVQPAKGYIGERCIVLPTHWGDVLHANFEPSSFLAYLNLDCTVSGYGSPSRFGRLPDDCTEGENNRPCNDSLRPCYEFVPPLRLILALLLIMCAAFVCGYGNGWGRLLCFPLAFFSGCLLLFGHRYWCEGNSNNYHDFPHDDKSVTQKYLTSCYLCNTVIGMANVLSKDKQSAVIGALAEGSSIRSIERITGIHRDTIMRLGVHVGKGCEMLLDSKMQDLGCRYLQFDEVWGFIGKKERHLSVGDDAEMGDVWTYCAIDAETKLVPTFKVGKRNRATTTAFVQDVASRLRNRVQISTDALHGYIEAVEQSFGADVDYGQIVKVYTHDDAQHPERKYSAPHFASAMRRPIAGNPEMELVSTSHIERLNATTRLHVKRLSRLTLAFSKKLENFKAAVALHFAYYNLVRRHNTLRCTPAMAAGIERDFWTVENLVEATV
jgi:IS1 family transposase